MFGSKERHKEMLTQVEDMKEACEALAVEVYELKEMLKKIDISHIVMTMDHFIESTTYIQHILENASIDTHDQDNFNSLED